MIPLKKKSRLICGGNKDGKSGIGAEKLAAPSGYCRYYYGRKRRPYRRGYERIKYPAGAVSEASAHYSGNDK